MLWLTYDWSDSVSSSQRVSWSFTKIYFMHELVAVTRLRYAKESSLTFSDD